jgi:hypothetical protein
MCPSEPHHIFWVNPTEWREGVAFGLALAKNAYEWREGAHNIHYLILPELILYYEYMYSYYETTLFFLNGCETTRRVR